MAPRRGESIERSDEHDEFMKSLADYHEKRGTNLDPEPKLGVRRIDLRKLYERVVSEGGYDLCSDTKAKPLFWRKIGEEFIGKNPYSAAQAFQIKQIYYKNLVAYEITNHWKQEPPPKEILEDVSAKGGGVMGRTLENFAKPPSKDEKMAESSPEQKTPTQERAELVDDPGSAGARTTRGLRQQPSQRVLFQPETQPGRMTRGQHFSPGALPNGIPNGITNGASSTLASYEPSQSYPLSLKPVITPANNPEHYRNERKRKLEAMAAGTGFIGPNIYVRAQMALQSGIPDEERYALHHLVKISHERGDKYRFDQFPGLAEALSRKILCASSLFYNVEWDINYEDDSLVVADDETLNGLQGTADIISRLKSRPLPISNGDILDGEFLDHISRITEAALVFRNMCTMEENARYAASLALARDVIAVTISLPEHWVLTELRQYMLEIAEAVLKYCDLDTQDDLYAALISQLESDDRGTVILAMRTISRLAMTLPPPKQLELPDPRILHSIQDWLLVEDEELRGACLDFLMQYTTFAVNVETLLKEVDAETLARQLGRLLLYDAREISRHGVQPQPREDNSLIPPVPRLSKSVVTQLLKLEEPERSSEWLRMCFVQDPNSEMTQISLWQAYQGTFGTYHGNLIAGEFIKNVSAVYQGATAQVAGQNKYVIRGIRSRKAPVETALSAARPSDKGKELIKCLWQAEPAANGVAEGVEPPRPTRSTCGEWFRDDREMLKHILGAHLQLPTIEKPQADADAMDVDTKPEGMTNGTTPDAPIFNFSKADDKTYQCRWSNCYRTSKDFVGGKMSSTALFARHIETHLPDGSALHARHNVKQPDTPSTRLEPLQLAIMTDEKHDAAGLPLSAALVLSHIARFMPGNVKEAKEESTDAEQDAESSENAEKLIEKVFGLEIKNRMFFALAHCPPARAHVGTILRNIRRNAGS